MKSEIVHIGMSELYIEYQREFLDGLNRIDDELENIHLRAQDKKKLILNEVQHQLDQARTNLTQMEIEVTSMPPQTKTEMDFRVGFIKYQVRRYRGQVEDAQRKYGQAYEGYMTKKNAETMMGGEASGFSYEHHQKLLNHQGLVSEQNDQLRAARLVMNDTRQVANGTIVELRSNSEKLYAVNDKTTSINSRLGRANQLINTMTRRNKRNKLILLFVALLLIATVVITFYFAFIR